MTRIKVSDSDVETLLLYSFRYALGRMSYSTYDVSNLLIKYKRKITKAFKMKIVLEIKEAIENNTAGMSMDIENWESVIKEFNLEESSE